MNQSVVHLDCIEINPEQTTKKTIIWLHGLGADGSDFVPIVPELKLPMTAGIRFVFPHAPIKPITINNGYEMRAWYDIKSMDFDRTVDQAGIDNSMQQVNELIKREVANGISTDNIILAGFSQGAAIALTTGLRAETPVGGIIALSGYLPFHHHVLKNMSGAAQHTPIFIAHGTEDPIVPYALGKATYTALKEAGCQIEWHSYSMPHSVCSEEIQDIREWLMQRL